MSFSYVSAYFENIALAEICSRGELAAPCSISITVSPQTGIVEMKAELEGSGVDMPGNGVPNRGSAAKWFAQLLKQFASDNLEVDDTDNLWADVVKEIDEKAAEIDEQLEYAELIFQRNDPKDCTFNSHYEQVYLDKRTAKITGMDYYSWEDLWDSHDSEEFERFLDSHNKLGIEAYSPMEYPFWLFLEEGWAEKNCKKRFFRKMMERYGTKTIQVGKYAIMEFEQKKEQLFERINNRFVDPRTVDFSGKIVSGDYHLSHYCAPILQESPKTAGLKIWHLFDRQILRYGGRPTQSLTSNSDYYVIARNIKTFFIRAPYKDTDTPEDLEIERYERYMDHSRFIFEDLDKYDAMRIRRGKKPVQFILEDEFNTWLLDTFPPCDEETLRSEDSRWLFLRNDVMRAVEKNILNARNAAAELRAQEAKAAREKLKQERLVLIQEEKEKKEKEKSERETHIAELLLSMKDQCESTGIKYSTMADFWGDSRLSGLKLLWIEQHIQKNHQQKTEEYLMQNGMLMTEKERILAQIEEVLDMLTQRYTGANKKAMSVRDVAKENPDVDMRIITEHAAFYTGKTPRVLLTEKGIIYRDEELQSGTSQPKVATQIPDNIRKRMDTLFAKLDEAYPDKILVRLNQDHKKWGETISELYRALGYENAASFLSAYGYTYAGASDKGGRPKKNPMEIIEELQRRYPNGTDFTTVDELKAANPDIASRFQSLRNKSNEYFGMPFTQYLRSIGLIK